MAMAGVPSDKLRVKPSSHVLIVEDDVSVSKLIKTYLEREDYRASIAGTVAQMRSTVAETKIDLVILDLRLPDENGWSALRWLREHHGFPVIVLTGEAETTDRVIGLELGADDYIAKPFDLRELLARIRTIERRLGTTPVLPPSTAESIRFAGWILDISSQQLTSDCGSATHLTCAEYRILVLLATEARRVVSRDTLLDAAAGRHWDPFDRSIDVHISNLRRKIDLDPKQPSLIRTVRGAGYMFVPNLGA